MSRGSFSLPPDHEILVSWMEEFRQWRRDIHVEKPTRHLLCPLMVVAASTLTVVAVGITKLSSLALEFLTDLVCL